MNTLNKTNQTHILVLGSTGKTGSRIAQRLQDLNYSVRHGSRSATPPFDWTKQSTWKSCLEGIDSVYISYATDLGINNTANTIKSFVDAAKEQNIKRIVMLTGRGEEEAVRCEEIVQNSGIRWTIVRSSWFNQNFSETSFAEMVKTGQITLPAKNAQEPFIDVEDLAEVIVKILTQPGHSNQTYELTGPRLISFSDIAQELSKATGKKIQYIDIPHQAFVNEIAASGAPHEIVNLMDYLFSKLLDGRNAYLTQDLEQLLERKPKDFSDFSKQVAATGTWNIS